MVTDFMEPLVQCLSTQPPSSIKMPTKLKGRPQITFTHRRDNNQKKIVIFFKKSRQNIMMKLLLLTNFMLTLTTIGSTYGASVQGKSSLQRAITFTEPTKPLQFRDNVKKKPKRKNLKKSRLLRKMGTDFKGQWMSIEEPANVDATTVNYIFQNKLFLHYYFVRNNICCL